MTETGAAEDEYNAMYFGRWLDEQMRRRGIDSGLELARLLSEQMGTNVPGGTVSLWRSKRKKERYTLSTGHIHALAAVLHVPVEAVVLAEARARGVKIPPRALLASSVPAWTDKLPTKDSRAWLALLDRLGIAHGLTD